MVLKTANSVTRSADVPVDVELGDIVKLTNVSADVHETTVIGFVAEVEASTIAANGTPYSNNKPTSNVSSSSSSVVATGGNASLLIKATPAYGSYQGKISGYLTETYTVEVIAAGTLGTDVVSVKVTSASGTDNVASVDLTLDASTDSDAFAVGTRGLTAVYTGSLAYPLGHKTTFTVVQTYVATSNVTVTGGTYTGPKDTAYIVTVLKGGVVGTHEIKLSLSTTNGVDIGGPYTFATTYTPGTQVAVGNYGVTIALAAGSVVTGDKYHFAATAEADAGIQTLVLADSVPSDMLAEDLKVELFKLDDVQIPAAKSVSVANWTQEALDITLNADIAVDLGYGALPVLGGSAYVEWRGLRQVDNNVVKSIDDVALLGQHFAGYVGPDSVLAYGVSKALANSNGTDVRFASISGTEVADWTAALESIKETDDVYGLAPQTNDRAVKDLVASHVQSESGPEQGRWRVAWFGNDQSAKAAVVGEADEVTATIIDNPGQSGTQYTLVVAVDGEFITKGVRSGDKLRTGYVLSASGEIVYDEYTIDTVVNNNRLVLASGPSVSVVFAEKIEIWRTLNAADKTAQLILANSFASKRVRSVFPAKVETAEGTVDSFVLAAALAGLRSGVAPHQGLTNVAVAGFTGVNDSVNVFTRTQLDSLANAGFWIVTQDVNTGTIYTRKQLTSDVSSVETAEDSVVSTDDAIAYAYAAALAKYIGRTNVTDSNLALIEADIDAVTAYLKNTGTTANLGSMVIDAKIRELRRHAIYPDRVVVVVDVVRPAPLNNLELYLVYGF